MLEQKNMTQLRVPSLLFTAIVTALLLSGCATRQNDDAAYRTVHMDITYGPHDKRDREWNALMVALDRCHRDGYSDAQPAAKPETRCLDNGPDGCLRFTASLRWDCIGMGYQPN